MLYPVELQALAAQICEINKKDGRGREIRTPDILLPKQARYQTALYPEKIRALADAKAGMIRSPANTVNPISPAIDPVRGRLYDTRP